MSSRFERDPRFEGRVIDPLNSWAISTFGQSLYDTNVLKKLGFSSKQLAVYMPIYDRIQTNPNEVKLGGDRMVWGERGASYLTYQRLLPKPIPALQAYILSEAQQDSICADMSIPASDLINASIIDMYVAVRMEMWAKTSALALVGEGEILRKPEKHAKILGRLSNNPAFSPISPFGYISNRMVRRVLGASSVRVAVDEDNGIMVSRIDNLYGLPETYYDAWKMVDVCNQDARSYELWGRMANSSATQYAHMFEQQRAGMHSFALGNA